MAATLKFDQIGKPGGDNNRSREDITPGLAVQITNVFPGAANSLELLWKPPEDDTAVINGADPNYTIVPKVGTDGTYLFRLTVDGDFIDLTFSTVTALFALPIMAPNEKADPTASLINNGEPQIVRSNRNEAFGPFTAGSAFGWWPVVVRWFRKLESLFNPSGGHDHSGAGDNGPAIAHDSLAGVTEDQHHGRQHALDSAADHTGALPESSVAFDGTGHDHTGGPGGAVVDHSSLNDDQPEKHRLINDAATSPIELWSAQKINAEVVALSSGYNRRPAVIDLVDNTAAPPTESTGDRYILDFTAGTVDPNWDGAAKGDIVQFDGAVWIATTPAEGWVCYVDAQNKDALYVDDGTPNWELRNVYSRLHSDLTDVSADQHHAQIHGLASGDHSSATLAAFNTKISDGTLVDKDSTNTWGAKQSFSDGAPATTAPANVAPYDADPSTPANGDVVLTSALHPSGPGKIRSYIGGSWYEAGGGGVQLDQVNTWTRRQIFTPSQPEVATEATGPDNGAGDGFAAVKGTGGNATAGNDNGGAGLEGTGGAGFGTGHGGSGVEGTAGSATGGFGVLGLTPGTTVPSFFYIFGAAIGSMGAGVIGNGGYSGTPGGSAMFAIFEGGANGASFIPSSLAGGTPAGGDAINAQGGDHTSGTPGRALQAQGGNGLAAGISGRLAINAKGGSATVANGSGGHGTYSEGGDAVGSGVTAGTGLYGLGGEVLSGDGNPGWGVYGAGGFNQGMGPGAAGGQFAGGSNATNLPGSAGVEAIAGSGGNTGGPGGIGVKGTGGDAQIAAYGGPGGAFFGGRSSLAGNNYGGAGVEGTGGDGFGSERGGHGGFFQGGVPGTTGTGGDGVQGFGRIGGTTSGPGGSGGSFAGGAGGLNSDGGRGVSGHGGQGGQEGANDGNGGTGAQGWGGPAGVNGTGGAGGSFLGAAGGTTSGAGGSGVVASGGTATSGNGGAGGDFTGAAGGGAGTPGPGIHGKSGGNGGYGVIAEGDSGATPVRAALRLVPQDADPSVALQGDMIATSASHPSGGGLVRFYDGTVWKTVTMV